MNSFSEQSDDGHPLLSERTPWEHREALLHAYRTKWEEFNDWLEQDASRSIEARASVPPPPRTARDDEVDEQLRALAARREPVRMRRLYPALPEPAEVEDVPPMSPVPVYEWVTPAPRNVTRHEQHVTFLPFAGEPLDEGKEPFDYQGYLDLYQDDYPPQWQEPTQNTNSAYITGHSSRMLTDTS
jgi:hypothetical protein